MRNAFTEAICEVARQDPRIVFLVSDIGNITFDCFRREFPERFLNVGVAEANMIGVSAGLALAGKIPIAYTIASFEVFRAFEQIRDDVCYQNLPVKIVGVGGGLAYSTLGPTHHTVEDVAMFRAVPNMTILCPADPIEAKLLAFAAVERSGPVYVRLAKAGEPRVHAAEIPIRVGQAIRLTDGEDVTLIATGVLVWRALKAAQTLRAEGVHAAVLDMHTLKPLDERAVTDAARRTGAIVTLEEHSLYGGLGGAVAEVIAEQAPGAHLKRLGLPDRFCSEYGTQDYLLDRAGLSVEAVARAVSEFLVLKNA